MGIMTRPLPEQPEPAPEAANSDDRPGRFDDGGAESHGPARRRMGPSRRFPFFLDGNYFREEADDLSPSDKADKDEDTGDQS